MARLCAVALASCGAPYRSAGAWPWTELPDLPFDAGYRQPDVDRVGVAQVLCLADACLYRHKITPLLRKEGRFPLAAANADFYRDRSEEHTSELQSRGHLVCRLLLEKKRKN